MKFQGRALALLEEGSAPHRLVLSADSSDSVLGESPRDPALLGADIAFGQPSRAQVEEAARLRWVQLSSAGYARFDHADFRAHARGRGLLVSNSSSVFDDPCAQHVLAFMLAHVRRLPAAFETQRTDHAWESLRQRLHCRVLRDQTVLLLGYGSIGERLAELLEPFGVRVAGFRRSPTGAERVKMIAEEELPAALAAAEHVVNLLPNSPATVGFVDARRLASMRLGAVFYNIGRGTTVDQRVLRAALASGRLAAAYLDVTDPEPLPPDDPLWTTPNCFITPHVGGGHQDERIDLARHFIRNLKRFESGEPLGNRIM